MASDTKDNTVWAGLRTQAEAGTLKFDSSQAVTGAQACADMVGVMKGFRQFADANNLAGLKDFTKAQYSSSGVLTRGFNDQGQALLNAFDMHAAALTDMAEYFRAAGRAYAHAENQSKDVFDKLADVSIPKSATNLGLTAPKDLDDFTNGVSFDDDVKGPWKDQKKASLSIHLENKDKQSWSDLYHLGQNISDAINDYYYAGETWKYLAGEVDTRVGEFNNKIQALDWTGAGAGGAKDASTQYANDLKPLVDTMKEVAVNLRYASQWMGNTMVDMPDHEKQDTGSCSDDDLDDKRNKFQDDYLTGVSNCASVMAVVPSPTAVQDNGGKDNGGKDNGGKDNGGKDNGGKDNGGKDNGGKDNGGKDNGGKDNGGKDNGGDNTGGKDNGGANNGGANSGGANSGGANSGGGSQYKQPNIPPLKDTADPNGGNPNGTNPNGTNPNGTNPNGTNPNGANPNGTNPYGSNPYGSNQNYPNQTQQQTGSTGSSSGGSDMSSLTSMLSSLVSGVSTGISTIAQQLPTILQALDSMHSTDLTNLATALGVPEDKLTTAFAAIEQDPSKVTQLSQLLGLSGDTTQTPTPTPTAGLPGDTVPLGTVNTPNSGLANAIPAAGVPDSPFPGLTNLFGGGSNPGAMLDPLVGVVASPSDQAVPTATEIPTAAADPEPEQVDFIRGFGRTLEGAIEGNPVVEA